MKHKTTDSRRMSWDEWDEIEGKMSRQVTNLQKGVDAILDAAKSERSPRVKALLEERAHLFEQTAASLREIRDDIGMRFRTVSIPYHRLLRLIEKADTLLSPSK